MWSRLLSSWLVLVFLYGSVQAATPDPYELQGVINAMSFDGVEVTLEWEECGEENAYYFHSKKLVVLCEELKALSPGVIRFFLAHEMAHAVIMQRDIPYTGLHEQAADELAATVMAATGREDDILQAAAWFWIRNTRDIPWAPHPNSQRRAHYLRCIALEAQGETGLFCGNNYARLLKTWVRLLDLE